MSRSFEHIKNWEEGSEEKVPAGWHVHHLIMKSRGGSDDYDNLICVSPELHEEIHRVLGDRYNDPGHTVSSNLLSNNPNTPVVSFCIHCGCRCEEFEDYKIPEIKYYGKVTGRILSICNKTLGKNFAGYQWFHKDEVGDSLHVKPSKIYTGYNNNKEQAGWQKWEYDKMPGVILTKNDVGRILMGVDYTDKKIRPHGSIFKNNNYFNKHFKRI